MIALVPAGAKVLTGLAIAEPNCTCRANGQNFQIGEILCIRGRLSQCQMNQNNPTWAPIADTCPQSFNVPQPPAVASAQALPSPSSSLPN